MRTRVKHKNGYGGFKFAYAILTEENCVWCFDSKEDKYGYTIFKEDIVKIYK